MQVAALSSRITNTLRLTPNRASGDVKPRSAVIECAHKKGTGSTKNGRDSNPKYLGVKKYGEEKVQVGSIIVRQRGNKFHAGDGVGTGKDFTLYALREGEVKFKVGANKKKFVTVVDAIDRSGREDGQPTRKDKRREMYTPRAALREAAATGAEVPKRVAEPKVKAAAAAPAKKAAPQKKATQSATGGAREAAATGAEVPKRAAEPKVKAAAAAPAKKAAPQKKATQSATRGAPKGFYRQVNKVKYDNHALLVMDAIMEEKGVISLEGVKALRADVDDGKRVTAIEVGTLEFVLNGGGGKYAYNCDDAAKAFLTEEIAALKAKMEGDAGAR